MGKQRSETAYWYWCHTYDQTRRVAERLPVVSPDGVVSLLVSGRWQTLPDAMLEQAKRAYRERVANA